VLGNFGGQHWVGVTGKNHEVVSGNLHLEPS
jgi:hypothetical protein